MTYPASVDFSAPIRVALPGDRDYPIRFGPLEGLGEALIAAGLRPGRCLVVTDAHVASLYGERVLRILRGAGWTPDLYPLPPGETTKAFGPLRGLLNAALTRGIDRETPVLALGGGVVGDLAGFAAAILLRGLPFIQVPTTLIAQVDSAIGGKTGINHETGKNLVGAFHQPRLVYTDPSLLDTLPEREWRSGLAEVIKHALIASPDLMAELETGWDELYHRRADVVGRVVYRAAAIKAAVVSEDEHEHGLRAILNFGHTFGHAIETVAGYGRFTHGEAVLLGMRAALHLSARLHGVNFDPCRDLVSRVPVPPLDPPLSLRALMAASRGDKKARQGAPRYVLLDRPGHACLPRTVPGELVREAWVSLGPGIAKEPPDERK